MNKNVWFCGPPFTHTNSQKVTRYKLWRVVWLDIVIERLAKDVVVIASCRRCFVFGFHQFWHRDRRLFLWLQSRSQLLLQKLVFILHLTSATSTLYRWCTVVSGHWNMTNPRLKISHEGTAIARGHSPSATFSTEVIIFQCRTNDHASDVLSYGQPLA